MKREVGNNAKKKGEKEVVYTTSEAADVLNVKPSQVRSLCRQGRIPYKHHETNYKIMIRESDLKKYIKEGVRKSGRGRVRRIDER